MIPKTIEVLHLTYTVELVSSSDLGGDMGDIDTSRQVIRIADNQKEWQLIDTLAHEWAHAMYACLGIEDDEVLACQFGMMFSCLLKTGAFGQANLTD